MTRIEMEAYEAQKRTAKALEELSHNVKLIADVLASMYEYKAKKDEFNSLG